VLGEEELVGYVAEDLDEAFGLAELENMVIQGVLALLEAPHEAELPYYYSDFYAVAGFPHLVRAGPAPLCILLKVLPRLH